MTNPTIMNNGYSSVDMKSMEFLIRKFDVFCLNMDFFMEFSNYLIKFIKINKQNYFPYFQKNIVLNDQKYQHGFAELGIVATLIHKAHEQ